MFDYRLSALRVRTSPLNVVYAFCYTVYFFFLPLCSLGQHTLVTYSYQSVITFGGFRDDFMVVVSQQGEPGVPKKSVEKLVFALAKPKVSGCSAPVASVGADVQPEVWRGKRSQKKSLENLFFTGALCRCGRRGVYGEGLR